MQDEVAAEDAFGKWDVLVIGAGPAGLAAAEVASGRGARVLLADAMPSVGRKFLMAGKSGLNLTKQETPARFNAAFAADGALRDKLTAFGPAAICTWAEGLGQTVFTGSTGRVFPTAMKASPLLRAWLGRLQEQGVSLRRRWRWTGWEDGRAVFATPAGERRIAAGAVVLALGGASWRRLGSDGAWSSNLQAAGVALAPFQPANMGFEMDWSDHMTPFFGQAVKGTRLTAGGVTSRGEWVVAKRGLEGGGIYEISAAVREGAALTLDLLPDLPELEIARRLSQMTRKQSLSNGLRKALRLDGVRRALLMEWGRPLPDGAALAGLLKALPVPVGAARPIDEAISVAGGVVADAVTQDLMLKTQPGVFLAGEMLDWEAPTGGYLISGCLSTGRHAGAAAARWADDTGSNPD